MFVRLQLLLVLVVLFTSVPFVNAEEPLESYRWQNRLIVYHLADSAAEAGKLRELISQTERELEDRDLLFIEMSAPLLKRFRVSSGRSTFILLGKDGSEKGRQSPQLDLGAFFKRIDQMPMRRAEMREKGR